MASVLPLRSARTGVVSYRVRFRIDGVQRQETFQTSRGAYEFAALVDKVGGHAAMRVLEARRNSTVDVPTLREWTERYLDPASGILTGVSDGTREGYRRIAERSFLSTLGDYPIDAIDKTTVGQWVSWQERQRSKTRPDQPLAAKTIRNYHALLSAVLDAALQAGMIPTNPAHRARLTKGRKEESVFLSEEEFTTLLHFIPDRYQGFVMFLAGTGCRWGEATAVTWGDVNLRVNPPTVRIDKAWKKGPTGRPVLGPPKSSRAVRTVSLSPDVVAALGERGASNDLLFPSPLSGGHLWYGRFRTSTWVPAVQRAQDPELCEAEGLEPLRKTPTVHDLRHSHASWLIARGVPLTLIQRRLGHENINTTSDVYGHLQPDAHHVMADAIGHALEGTRSLRQIRA